MFCLLSSTICHLFYCHSKTLNSHLFHLDYIGITIMIIASFLPPVYYIFHCTPHFQILYLTGITLIGIFTIFTLLSPALSASKYRSIHAMLFVSMGLFGLIAAVHGLAINWNDPHRTVLLGYESVTVASYLIGTMFYVRRIPERWMPGWFDLAGHRHQIFHVFVVMGALVYYDAAQAAAHGLPIVATKNGGPVDIHRVLDNGLLVDPHDQNSIAEALLKLVADKHLWTKCRANGLKNIHLFSWPEHCKTSLSRIASCKARQPRWLRNDDDDEENSESNSPSDSLRDIQDVSLNLKFSFDADKNQSRENLDGSLDSED